MPSPIKTLTDVVLSKLQMMDEVTLLATQLPEHMEEVAAMASSTLATLHMPLLPPCLKRFNFLFTGFILAH